MTEFVIISTSKILKCYSPSKLVFGCDIIIPIKHTVDWESICQRKHTQINKDDMCENSKSIDHEIKVGDKVMLNINTDFKYETPYKKILVITKCWTNGMITL